MLLVTRYSLLVFLVPRSLFPGPWGGVARLSPCRPASTTSSSSTRSRRWWDEQRRHAEVPARATRTPRSAGPSSTGRSRPTTPWACTTPGAAPTRTSTTASGPCAATSCATRTASTARASGSRSRSRRSWASSPSTTSRRYGVAEFVEACKERVRRFAAIQTRAVDPPRLLDGLGQQLLHQLGREQLHDLGLPQEVLRQGLALQGPRHDALVPALRHRHLAARDRHRGLPGDHAPVGLPEVPASPSAWATGGVGQRAIGVQRAGESLLVWTTTPWTLAANVAAAVQPGADLRAR